MALDRGLVGRSYPPSAVYEVGRAKIAEFAAAIGDDDPAYRDAEAARARRPSRRHRAADVRHRGDPGGGRRRPGRPRRRRSTTAGSCTASSGSPTTARSAPVTGWSRTTTIEDVRSVAGNDLLTTRVDLATEDGEPVCTATSMLVARGTA